MSEKYALLITGRYNGIWDVAAMYEKLPTDEALDEKLCLLIEQEWEDLQIWRPEEEFHDVEQTQSSFNRTI